MSISFCRVIEIGASVSITVTSADGTVMVGYGLSARTKPFPFGQLNVVPDSPSCAVTTVKSPFSGMKMGSLPE